MVTLHEVSEKIKLVFKLCSITIVAFFLIVILFRVGGSIKEYFYPTPPPPPTVIFGKLPKIFFSQNIVSEGLAYTLNTLSGKLPNFSDRVTVFKLVNIEPSLLSLTKAQEKVSKIGFTSQGTALSDTTYLWQSGSSKISFDILFSNFNYSSNYFSDQEVLSANHLPDENEAISKATSFLTTLDFFANDIDNSKTKTALFAIKDLKLSPATSLSNAKIIRVDFFQKDIEKLPIFYPNPPNSTINLFVGSGTYEGKVVEANFFYQGVSEISATYPIITAEEAFDELKNGNAYIASYFGNKKEISIKNVFLGYYLGEQRQEYLIPIVIFEGNDGFFAYVPAVKDDWISD